MLQRKCGISITEMMLQARAIKINRKLKGPEGFQASRGWLWGFKKSFGIRCFKISGEKLTADIEAANNFKEKFMQLIQAEGYSLEYIYNADETDLFYKSMPKFSLCSNLESRPSGFKENKQRVTVMLCSNADGSYKITPMVIGKYVKPRPLKDITKMPTVYKSQKNSWMTVAIFEDWHFNFLSIV